MALICQKLHHLLVINMKEELLKKYIMTFSGDGDFRYYSPNTLFNLIYHLDSLEEGNKKQQIVKGINEYLDFVTETPICSIQDSQLAYQEYLHPIIRYYVKKVGFVSYGKPQILIPLFLLPSLLLGFLLQSVIAWIIIGLFLIFSFTYNYQKYSEKKTYGLSW